MCMGCAKVQKLEKLYVLGDKNAQSKLKQEETVVFKKFTF